MGCLWQGLFSFHSEGSEKFSNLFVSSPLETMYPWWQINNIFLPDLYKQTLMEWIFFFSSIFLLCFFFKFDKLNFIAFPPLLFEIFNHFLYHKFLFSTLQYVNGFLHTNLGTIFMNEFKSADIASTFKHCACGFLNKRLSN